MKIAYSLICLFVLSTLALAEIEVPTTGTEQEQMRAMVALGDKALANGEDCLALGYYQYALRQTNNPAIKRKIARVEQIQAEQEKIEQGRLKQQELAVSAKLDREMVENEKKNATYWDLESRYAARFLQTEKSQGKTEAPIQRQAPQGLLKWEEMMIALIMFDDGSLFAYAECSTLIIPF